jgi:ceramide glucosyltransferase
MKMLPVGQLIVWAGDLFFAASLLSCAYMAVCWTILLCFDRRRLSTNSAPVPVTILMPLCGAEPGLDQRLRALRKQDYAAPIQIVCGTRNPADPAIEIVARIAAECPAGVIEIHVDSRANGRNLKIANLTNMLRHARHDVLVMIDSDIEVNSDYLSTVMAELQRPGAGAVTCLYRGVSSGGFWANLSALEIDCQFLPNAILGLSLRLARPCFGATIALSRATLDGIGGFRTFLDQLWDDYAIGEAVRQSGSRVFVIPLALGHVCSERSGRELIDRQVRMARTIRGINPTGYAGSLITHPFPLAVMAMFCGGGTSALLLAILALACRLGVGRSVERRFGGRRNSYWVLPIREFMSFAIYVSGFFGSNVTWRGRRYRLLSDGTVTPHPE